MASIVPTPPPPNAFCDLWQTAALNVWFRQPFPIQLYRRLPAPRIRELNAAWNYFETVEAYDASVRLRLTQAAGYSQTREIVLDPKIWYRIGTGENLMRYRMGQALHKEQCPETNWTPQRDLGLGVTLVTDVRPEPCPLDMTPLLPMSVLETRQRECKAEMRKYAGIPIALSSGSASQQGSSKNTSQHTSATHTPKSGARSA